MTPEELRIKLADLEKRLEACEHAKERMLESNKFCWTAFIILDSILFWIFT